VRIDEDSYGQIASGVVDTGIGIAPENHAKIFQGVSTGGSLRRLGCMGGTGLGMSIVQRIVDRDGWHN